jgi:glycosyltransferase involved in cell wall biosynthesis
MKIAIATDWFAPRRGGIEAQLVQLAAGLAGCGHEIGVLTSTPGASAAHGYSVRRIGRTTFPGTQLALSPTMVGDLRRELERGYDVLHAHVSVVSPVGYAAAAVARTMGLPAVVTFHSVLRFKRHLLRAIDAVANLSGSPIVWTGVSQLVASQLRDALSGATVSVLPNGIDVGFWNAARTAQVRTRQPVTLVSAMRLHRKKRPRQLLSAFAAASSAFPVPALLRIVGDGPERAAMDRDIRALGLAHGPARAEMLGWLAPEALRAVYADSDGFVLASTRESFGIAALEAAVAGLPVIAMAESGSREFLADEATHFLCRDDEHLARTIARFVADPALRPRNRIDAARLKRYDWAAVLSEHEATYGRAIKRAAAAATAVVA